MRKLRLYKIISLLLISSFFVATFQMVSAEENNHIIEEELDIEEPDMDNTINDQEDPREAKEDIIETNEEDIDRGSLNQLTGTFRSLDINDIETYAMPSGGPWVGQLTKVPRSTATTVNIYNEPSLTTRITYLENGVNSGVFAMLDQSGNSYKIALSGVIGWVDKKYVDIYEYSKAASGYDAYQIENGRLVHYIGKGVNTNSWSGALDQGPAPSYLKANIEYISYDSHYFYPATSVGLNNLIADYNSGGRSKSINANNPYYNYFMWLPARTQSKLTATDYRNFLKSNGYNNSAQSRLYETEQLFINNGDRYAGNATLAFATAIHESGFGTSNFAKQRNNYFGHSAYDSAPGMATAYLDPDEGIAYHFGTYWSWRYLYPFSQSSYYEDIRHKGGSVGNKGVGMNADYASDPYWGEKIANFYSRLDRASGNKDYGRYTIGVFTDSGVNIRKEATTNSASVYKSTRAGMPVAILETKNGWYGFTSDLIIDANKNEPPAVPWTSMRFDTSTVYASSSYIKIVHEGKDSKLLPQKNVPYPNKPIVDKTSKNYTLQGNASLRPNASTNYSSILTIPKGATISGHATNNGYVQTIYNGNIGFVSVAEINGGGGGETPDLPKPGNTVKRTTENVYMRTGPGTGHSSIVLVPKGSTVYIGSPVNGWVHAKYGSYSGYMTADYFEDIPTDGGYAVGDVNGDGRVNSVDYMIIKNYIMGKRTLTAEEKVRADVNKDGKINSQDYMRIKNIIMGR